MEELDLKELFGIFWNKKAEIILITLFFLIIGVIYSYMYVTPDYKSSTTLVLTQSSNNTDTSDESITQTDLTLNSKLISTYSELIKSKAILGAVIQNLEIKQLTVEGLKKQIKVEAVNNTEIIKITVTNENSQYAAIIANEIAKVFSYKIVEIYNISNVYIVDKAEVNEIPYNINHIKDIIIFIFAGLIVSMIYAFISNLLDTTIKSEEDIEKLNDGMIVVASIPLYNEELNKGGKR